MKGTTLAMKTPNASMMVMHSRRMLQRRALSHGCIEALPIMRCDLQVRGLQLPIAVIELLEVKLRSYPSSPYSFWNPRFASLDLAIANQDLPMAIVESSLQIIEISLAQVRDLHLLLVTLSLGNQEHSASLDVV